MSPGNVPNFAIGFGAQKHADSQRSHIRTLRVVVAALVGVNVMLWLGWNNAPREITVRYPPDLRQGGQHSIDEIPDYSVYTFAHYIFQQLNRWEEDGAVDFAERIYALSAYLTPAYREALIEKYRTRGEGGELQDRLRGLQPLPTRGYDPSLVDVLDDDTWVAQLDWKLLEAAHGMIVKKPFIRYPVRVVRWNVDPEKNPWGLALDGYADRPERIPADALIAARTAGVSAASDKPGERR